MFCPVPALSGMAVYPGDYWTMGNNVFLIVERMMKACVVILKHQPPHKPTSGLRPMWSLIAIIK